ncbi:manganese efflux pump MntP [Halalkalibacter oceani]|uniref:Putative manganese efflux pump MntP n=1 Tax=Halalkalibacter oceani TaxID=1653776 RepID=A0A9X2DS88_9BACI|nr:manganese efflux pump MntP family protein [Halalkalibacter oceani]MCM3714268.1 manganese efflux pump MntP family protein [Halalkalibacter oceani]
MSEWVALFIMASALGMDAFSVSLGLGMLGLRLRQVFQIGFTIGIFHMIMPLLGVAAGKVLSSYFSMLATFIGGALLFLIGLQMVASAFKANEESTLKPYGAGMFLFALSVSLDSFSAGLGLGMLGAKTLLTVAMFGAASMLLAWTGLMMGRRFQHYIGAYGELLGGCILIGFGIKLFLPI